MENHTAWKSWVKLDCYAKQCEKNSKMAQKRNYYLKQWIVGQAAGTGNKPSTLEQAFKQIK